MIGIITSLFVGFIIGFIIGRCDNPKEEGCSRKLSLRESLFIVKNLIYNEPFVTLEEEQALRNIIDYVEEQIDKDDDLK